MKKIFLVLSLLLTITAYVFSLTACSDPALSLETSLIGAENMDFQTEPCTVKLNYGEFAADCGTLMVPENRANPESRLISLPITRIQATGSHPVEPIFHLEGGPGSSNMQARPLEALLANHDFVMVGYRGVDGAVKLDCPEVSQALKGDGVDVLNEASRALLSKATLHSLSEATLQFHRWYRQWEITMRADTFFSCFETLIYCFLKI